MTICFCSAHPNTLTCANQRACWTRHACVFSVQVFLCTKRSIGLSRSVCTKQCDYKRPNVVLICLTLCFLYSRKEGTREKIIEIQKENIVFFFSSNLICLRIELLSGCACVRFSRCNKNLLSSSYWVSVESLRFRML